MTAQDLRDALRARTLTREQAEALLAAVDVCEATLAFNAKPEDGTVIEPLLSVDDVREILDWVPLQAAGSGSTSK